MLPEQTVEFPIIFPGVDGIEFTLTNNVFAADEPHTLSAVTETFPLLDPAIVLIESVVEDPVQPEGNVQVYDVAPLTAAMR